MRRRKTVAVIGAGTSGLMAIKSLKEEGFEPTCYEKTCYFGGLWKYHEEDIAGVPSCMWSTSLNNSKELGAISDFPPNPKLPNFMRHDKVLEMFTEYAKTFDLLKHIEFNREVISVRKSTDYDYSGQWKVTVKHVEVSLSFEYLFDAVMVCSGHLTIPNIPKFTGQDNFIGSVIHTHSIKRVLDFVNKTVCVIGAGSSGLDAAVEISHVAKQVYLSVRTPSWIATRQGPYGYPLDWTLFNRDQSMLQKYVPTSLCNLFVESIYINPRFSHDLYNIHPKYGISCRDPAINDDIASRLMSGAVIMKKNVKYFTERGVRFEDDTDETFVDAVVLATGYKFKFPFLNNNILVTSERKINLYKCVYPPHLKHPTLGFIGFIVPMGPGFPCVEMQCRWFCHVLSGKSQLPHMSKLMYDINAQYENNVKRFVPNDRIYIHIDFVPYLDELASMIGCKPNFIKMLFSDFELFVACFFGPFLPYQYRLVGPHKWPGAREAILTASQRMRAPLQSQTERQKKTKRNFKKYVILSLIFIGYYMWKNNYINYNLLYTIKNVYDYLKKLSLDFTKSGKI